MPTINLQIPGTQVPTPYANQFSCLKRRTPNREDAVSMASPRHYESFDTRPGEVDYAPSLPNSCVHSSFLLRSTSETVGRLDLMALMKSFRSTSGSKSSSEGTASHVISMASGSPGEHGVSFSVSPSMTFRVSVSRQY